MKNTFRLLTFICLLLIAGFYSCSSNDDIEPFFKLLTDGQETTTDKKTVGPEATSITYEIQANALWTIVSSSGTFPEWINLTAKEGKGDSQLTLSLEPNSTSSNRTATFHFMQNGKKTATVQIDQMSSESFFVELLNEDDIPNSGGDIEIRINSTDSWSYELNGADWLSEKEKTDSKLVLTASENNSNKERSAKIKFNCGLWVDEVNITQLPQTDKIIADLLDLVFLEDGTAKDISPMGNRVITVEGPGMTTLYNNRYKRQIAKFSHTPGSAVSAGYYRVDYANNKRFKDALLDGHTLEALCMLDVDSPIPNEEIKMFSSHQAGGTGLMIGKRDKQSGLIFLPHVGGTYRWANSGITPKRGEYYHLVGVWDKTRGKASIYIDGQLKAEVNAVGEFKLPSEGSNWFGIGADPTGNNGQAAWKGNIVIARAYDKALNQQEVNKLWDQVKSYKEDPNEPQLTDVLTPSERVTKGGLYTILGEGFKDGDQIKFKSATDNKEFTSKGKKENKGLTVTLSKEIKSDNYRVYLIRGGYEVDLGLTTLKVVADATKMPQIIAHRGAWKNTGAPQNSIAGLIEAQKLKVYGAEFDVWITTDDHLILNHDPTYNDVELETSSYSKVKELRLPNGEPLPKLEEYLAQGKKSPDTKLILEIKNHRYSQNGKTNNDRVAEAVVKMVKTMNMTDQVEYIAFTMDVCKKIIELQPGAKVAFLGGSVSPKELHKLGFTGIDYRYSVLNQNKNWITEAQDLGMTVNVWTVNSESDLRGFIFEGVDFITTDEPELALKLTNQ